MHATLSGVGANMFAADNKVWFRLVQLQLHIHGLTRRHIHCNSAVATLHTCILMLRPGVDGQMRL
jgi:hypothetical protein